MAEEMAGALPALQVEDVENPDDEIRDNENQDFEDRDHFTDVQTSDGNDLPEMVPDPSVGMAFASYHEAYHFYRRYGEQKGFGIRVGNSSKRKDGRCRRILLNCWKADKGSDKPTYQLRTSAKTDCQAKIIARLRGDGLLHLVEVVHEHNHLLSPIQARFARSSRCMPVGVEKRMRPRKMHREVVAPGGEHGNEYRAPVAPGREHENEYRTPVAQEEGHENEHRAPVAPGGGHANQHRTRVAEVGGHENEHRLAIAQERGHEIEHPACVVQGEGHGNMLERYDCLVKRCLRVAKLGAISGDKFQLTLKLLGEVEKQLLVDNGGTRLNYGETIESHGNNAISKQGIPKSSEILDPFNVRRRGWPPKERMESNIENSSTPKKIKETVNDSNLSQTGATGGYTNNNLGTRSNGLPLFQRYFNQLLQSSKS